MKKNICRFLLILVISCLLTSSAMAAKTMKVSHNQQVTHPVHVALLSFKEEVESKTNGSIIVDIYPAAQIADDATGREQIMMGTLDSAMIMGAASTTLCQGTNNGAGYIEELPFLFNDSESARKAYDGAFGAARTAEAANYGVQVLCYWENGFRNMTNNTRPIVKPEDMAGIKFRIAPTDIRRLTFEKLNAVAIPMAFAELFTALQQGTVDGQENPLSIIETSKFYEVQKYLSMSRHIYNTASFCVNPDWFASLTQDEQTIIQEAALKARDYCRQLNDENEASALDRLAANGMEINEIDYDAFVAGVQPVWDYFTTTYGDELIKLAQNP